MPASKQIDEGEISLNQSTNEQTEIFEVAQ